MKNWMLYYYTAAICMVTIGASWGTYLLIQLFQKQVFTGLNLFEVNAHGQAQIYGWIAMMIIGSAYLILPRFFYVALPFEFLTIPIWGFLIVGTLLSILGLFITTSSFIVMMGGSFHLIGVLLFCMQIGFLMFRSICRNLNAILFLSTALFFFLVSTIYSFWHHLQLVQLPTQEALVKQVATFQAPLRDLQVHGTGLFMVFGVLLLIFLPSSIRSIRISWVLLVMGVLGECFLFLLYRYTQNHLFAAGLIIPWLLLLLGSYCFFIKGGVYSKLPSFGKWAVSWLFVSEVMLVLLPVYLRVSHLSFSHAYYGAIRHAVTVGFLTQMIFGMSHYLVSRIQRSSMPSLSKILWLLNIGCLWRVCFQVLTDFTPIAYKWIFVSGVLEVCSTCFWVISLFRVLSEFRLFKNRTVLSDFSEL